MNSEAMMTEDKARRAMMDAAKLAEDLRAETHGDDITAKLMAQVFFYTFNYIKSNYNN